MVVIQLNGSNSKLQESNKHLVNTLVLDNRGSAMFAREVSGQGELHYVSS